ncbi:MAG: vWA domain-containing protein [Myxococcales bacterium]|nr:hypothetical protein [Polyangiaceae bacterium]MDW8247968.1 vWA domain-containing protein [Myxococcales bacterium]
MSGTSGASGAAAGDDSGGIGGAGGTTGGEDGASGEGGQAGSGGCPQECKPPQFCGAKGNCLDAGTCEDDADCGGGKICEASTGTCIIGSSCGVTQIKAEIVPPNLLLVLDRSCTMKGKISGQSKWNLAGKAVQSLLAAYAGKLRFGMTLFPDKTAPDCQQEKFLFPPQEDSTPIVTLLTAAQDPKDPWHPGSPCVTNGAQTMKQASTLPELDDKTRKSYFVLVSDGLIQQVCNTSGVPEGVVGVVGTLFKDRGIPTYVIGFGSGQIDKAGLNEIAIAGGVPAEDPIDPSFKYYRAEDGAKLEEALQTIAQKSLSCEYTLEHTPPDPNDIHVFFDKKAEVLQDKEQKDGWDYNAATNQVSFFGPTCESLKSGKIEAVDIVLGCPGGSSGSGGSGGSANCPESQPCDLFHLCPDDPEKGKGFCQEGCCTFGKP